MSIEEIKDLESRPQRRVTLIYALIISGLMIEMAVLAVGSYLGVQAGEFWGTTKASRDSALAGSGLLAQGGRIAAVTTWLTPFSFVGIALFFAGIGVALSAIIPRIRLRAYAMATLIPQIKQRS